MTMTNDNDLEMQWKCNGNAMEMQWKCTGIPGNPSLEILEIQAWNSWKSKPGIPHNFSQDPSKNAREKNGQHFPPPRGHRKHMNTPTPPTTTNQEKRKREKTYATNMCHA